MRIATRGSELALWQARHVAFLLAQKAGVEAELVVVTTSGDQRTDVPISEIGGSGVFVKEVQAAVLDGRADIAVHSAKDLPSSIVTPGLSIGAVPDRADPRDALVGCSLAELPTGAVIATGSIRRQAQLAHERADLRFVSLRGNVPTRVSQAGRDGVSAVPVALAALQRLELADRAADILDPDRFVPQVGQGALAIECRTEDEFSVGRLAMIENVEARVAVDTERSFLARLGGDCDLPVGAHARVTETGEISLVGLLASHDGTQVLREERTGDSPEIGAALAEDLLAAGGDAILAARSDETE